MMSSALKILQQPFLTFDLYYYRHYHIFMDEEYAWTGMTSCPVRSLYSHFDEVAVGVSRTCTMQTCPDVSAYLIAPPPLLLLPEIYSFQAERRGPGWAHMYVLYSGSERGSRAGRCPSLVVAPLPCCRRW